MAGRTPVPLASFLDDEEDAKTVLISRHARMAWEDGEGEADLTTPAAQPRRDEAQLVTFESDASIEQRAPASALQGKTREHTFSPWAMALVIGMSVPIAVAAAAYLLA